MEVNVSLSYQDHAALVYKNLLLFVDTYLFKFISLMFFFLTKEYTLQRLGLIPIQILNLRS